MRLKCVECGFWKTVDLEITVLHKDCPHCGSTTWRHFDTPVKRYKLTRDDAKFLKGLHVRPEV